MARTAVRLSGLSLYLLKSQSLLVLLNIAQLISSVYGLKCWSCLYAENAPNNTLSLSTTKCIDPLLEQENPDHGYLKLMDCDTLPKKYDPGDADSVLDWNVCVKMSYNTLSYGRILMRSCLEEKPYPLHEMVQECAVRYNRFAIADPFLNFTDTFETYILEHVAEKNWQDSKLVKLNFVFGTVCVCNTNGCNSEEGMDTREPGKSELSIATSTLLPPRASYSLIAFIPCGYILFHSVLIYLPI